VLQRQDNEPCFLCETVPARWNDPAVAADPSQAGPERAGLERRYAELASGRTAPEELHAHLLQMCAMCQEMLLDNGECVSRERLLSLLDFRIHRLREMAPR
jgi:hypothetical protein